jgi:hypothetical protein
MSTQVSLGDSYRTTDPREVIALTGEVDNTSKELPGYTCQLKLDTGSRNLIQLMPGVETIARLDEPLYITDVEYKDKQGDEQTVRLETTPLAMLDLADDFDNVYITRSLTNQEDDSLLIRKIVAAWASLVTAKEQSDGNKSIDAMMNRVAMTAFDAMVDIVIANPSATGAVDYMVRKVANEQGVFKNYHRFYGDERLMTQVTLYVASVLMVHLGGMAKTEVKALHTMINETEAIAWAMASRKMAAVIRRR